jgi:hypothetical protein
MPWDVVAEDEGCPVSTPWGVRLETGRLLSCHGSKREALAQVAALHANENLQGRLSGAALSALAAYVSLADLDLKPTDAMVAEAERGLAWRDEFKRGGGAVGVARARDIANRVRLSPETVQRMASYFARHEIDKEGQGFNRGEDGYPSAGRIAWALWGGDPGKSWADARVVQIRNIKET